MFEFSIGGFGFEWNGAHTVNVFLLDYDQWADSFGVIDYRRPVDVFSLNYGRDDYTKSEVLSAALEWLDLNYV